MNPEDAHIERARRYPISVVATESDPPYRAEVTGFPRVLAGGDSPEEALACAISAVADALEYLDDEGLPAPDPGPTP